MPNARHQTFQIRGYCRRDGYLRITTVLHQCAVLYNAALQERRDAYRMQRVSISRIDQMKQLTLVRQDMPEWSTLDVNVGRGVLCRVDRAFQAFFKRVSKGQKPGFPRFRSRNRYSCIELSEVRPSMVKVSGRRKARLRPHQGPAHHHTPNQAATAAIGPAQGVAHQPAAYRRGC